MEAFKTWLETSPYAVPVVTVGLLLGIGIVGLIIKMITRVAAQDFYTAADILRLDVLATSAQGSGVPHLIGLYKGRNLEITGYQKPTTQGIIYNIVKIKIYHRIQLDRTLEFVYNAIRKPPLQKMTIEDKEHPLDSLKSMRVFDEDLIDDLIAFLNTYTLGSTVENSVLVFTINEVTFDRERSLAGNAEKIVQCIEDLHKILTRMEELSGIIIR